MFSRHVGVLIEFACGEDEGGMGSFSIGQAFVFVLTQALAGWGLTSGFLYAPKRFFS